ncbi:MAG: hypothetical protein IIT39_04295, partial [Clostridia bacterium]|nr:hypothetical protein [Clostridia bacterium]
MSAEGIVRSAVYFWLLIHISRAVDDLSDYESDSIHLIDKKTLSVYIAVLMVTLVGSSVFFFGMRGFVSVAAAVYLFIMEKFDLLTLLSAFVGCVCLFFMAEGAEVFTKMSVIVFLALTIFWETLFYVYKRSKRE